MRAKASMVVTQGLFYQRNMKKIPTKLAAMDSCFGLIRHRQHGIANKMVHGFPHRKMYMYLFTSVELNLRPEFPDRLYLLNQPKDGNVQLRSCEKVAYLQRLI